MPPVQLQAFGVETATPRRRLSDHFTARAGRRMELAQYRDARGATTIRIEDRDPGDIVELDFGEGAMLWTSIAGLREIVPRPGTRSSSPDGGVVSVPMQWDTTAERGVGELVLRTLSVFGIDPAQGIASLALDESIRRIESRLYEGRPGLRRVGATGQLEPLDRVDGAKERLLVLLHGAASHTQGSFAGLLDPGCPAWQSLRKEYGDRIYAFEHPTLSESPLRNAVALLGQLPDGARVDLLSHSRGGLVGELLCLGGLDEREAEWFDDTNREDDKEAIRTLGDLLEKKSITVGNFVRVACPARGTLLASRRLDIYLSVALNVVNEVVGDPLVGVVLKDAVLEVARRRTDATELPGIEAMMPESPFISFLHARDGRNSQALKSNLAVIEGSLAGGGFFSGLRKLLAIAYFLEQNDLVVNTAAMTGGIPRAEGHARALSMTGPRLTHFGYYHAEEGLDAISTVFTSQSGLGDLAGAGVRKLDPPSYRRPGKREARKVKAGTPQVLIVPDIFGTQLRAAGDRELWADVRELSNPGAFEALGLSMPSEGGSVAGTLAADRLTPAADEQWYGLSGGGRRIVTYDWRGGATAAAESLRLAIDTKRKGPTYIVAHGLGGLGFLHLLASDREYAEWWRKAPAPASRGHGMRAVLLGVPLDGAEALLELAAGEGPIFRALYFLDRSSDQDRLRKTLLGWEGVVDLLPAEALDPSWWRAYPHLAAPSDAALEGARARREGLAAMVRDPEIGGTLSWVFGAAAETPRPQESATLGPLAFKPSASDGDGWFRENTTGIPRSQRWYLAALHTRLPQEVAPALGKLLPLEDSPAGEEEGAASPELHRDRPTALRRYVSVAGVYPSQQDLDWLISGVGEQSTQVELLRTLEVEVAHGGLEYTSYPVAVGHYQGDSVLGAEWILDQEVEGAITDTLALDLFRARAGEGIHISPPAHAAGDDDEAHKGALLIGLGNMGDLKASHITSGVVSAALDWALRVLQDTPRDTEADTHDPEGRAKGVPEPADASFATLLIGTRGGAALSIAQSIEAIVLGALLANRQLQTHGLGDRVRVKKKVQFVELWEDLAHRATHEARGLPQKTHLFDLREDEEIIVSPHLRSLEGGRKNLRALESEWSWWRRLTIEEEKAAQRDQQRTLRFTSTGRRARSEVRSVLQNPDLVDETIRRSSHSIDGLEQGSLSATLFQLLLPNAIKESILEDSELVLVVDEDTARYPWELLATQRDDRTEPLTRRMGMIRQFKTENPPEIIRASTTRRVLVIGEPADTGALPLDGAKEEAREVADLLAKSGWEVTRSIQERDTDILDRLCQYPYRIVHIAAHGRYDPRSPLQSGILVGQREGNPGERRQVFLSTDVFDALPGVPDLVFLNCCHLARADDRGALREQAADPRWPELASSVSRKLIEIGVRCVVAAGWAVNDQLAKVFALKLYASMLDDHMSFGDAVRRAREATMGSGRAPRGTTWGAFQCYGNPTFQLRPPRTVTPPVRPVSETEVMNEIENIALRAPRVRTPKYAESLVAKLEGLVAEVPESWRGGGHLASLTAASSSSSCPQAVLAVAAWHANRVSREELIEYLAGCSRDRDEQRHLPELEVALTLTLLQESSATEAWDQLHERYEEAHARARSRAKREAIGRLRFIQAVLEKRAQQGESLAGVPERVDKLRSGLERGPTV